MVEWNAVKSVTVMRYRVGNDVDFCHCGWIIEFNMSWKMFSVVRLETARGKIRQFTTLDAVEIFLNKLGVFKYEVVSVKQLL